MGGVSSKEGFKRVAEGPECGLSRGEWRIGAEATFEKTSSGEIVHFLKKEIKRWFGKVRSNSFFVI